MSATGPKFDIDAAWRETTRVVTDNATLLSAIAGIFVFLPLATLLLMLPAVAVMPELPDNASLEARVNAMQAFYDQSWWAFLLAGLVVTVGMLAMLALLGRRERPTVGEAIAIGGKSLASAWAALFVMDSAIYLAMVVIVGLAVVTGLSALAFVATLAAFVVALYLYARLSLALPVIAVEGEYNPFKALTSSWRMTRGHGGRMLLFYALLAAAGFVVIVVTMLITGLLLALAGPTIEEAGSALVSASIMSALMVLFTAVLAALRRQLRRLEIGGASVPRSGSN